MQGNNAAAIAPGRLIRRLDPRTKLALLLMSFVMVLLPQRPAVVALGAAAVLLHLTLARAWALEARGFQMGPRRTFLLEIRLQSRDYLALSAAAGCLALFLLLHLWGWDRIPGLSL
jgi:energy-coupling factor transporter transmembrane protein EcfT